MVRIPFILLLLFVFFCGCSQTRERQQTGVEQQTVTDAMGRRVEVPQQPQRVLALASSLTEMLFAVVPDSMIIARTQACNYPEQALKKPVVNSYPVDVEKILQLKPDLIFTKDGMTPPDDVEKLTELGVPVYIQKYDKVTDIFSGLEDLGKLLNQEKRARLVADSLRQELARISRAAEAGRGPRVLVITWPDPIQVYGQNTFLTDMLRHAGARNAVEEVLDQPYPALTREYILKINPDVILGNDVGRLQDGFFELYPELKRTKAYQTGKIITINDDLLSRPGPRVVESVKTLTELLH